MKRTLLALSTALSCLGLVGCGAAGTINTSGTQQVQLGVSSSLESEVTTMFTELLGVAPTSAQLTQYVTMLQNGSSMASVEAAILALSSSSSSSSGSSLSTSSGSSTISASTANSEITSLFQSVLSRAPSAAELATYSTMLQNGVSLSTIQTLINL